MKRAEIQEDSREGPKAAPMFPGLCLALLSVTGCADMEKAAECFNQQDCRPGETCRNGFCEAGTDGIADSETSPCREALDFSECSVTTSPDYDYDICVEGRCISPGCGDETCNVPGPGFAPADTNQRRCYDNRKAIDCPESEADSFWGQDAQYGWDATHNPEKRFYRITSHTEHPVVEDKVTGLMWQGCLSSADLTECESNSAAAVWRWGAALQDCEALSWGGFDDWRLPSEYELMSIMDMGQGNSALPDVFDPAPEHYLLSSSTHPHNDSFTYAAAFTWSPNLIYQSKEADTPDTKLRCVRGGVVQDAPRFRAESTAGEMPVTFDTFSDLQWLGCVGISTESVCTGPPPASMQWQEALAYCAETELGEHKDWRLPNAKELQSLVDTRSTELALRETFTPSVSNKSYWSATTATWMPSRAWIVSFDDGRVVTADKTAVLNVRCVRDRNPS